MKWVVFAWKNLWRNKRRTAITLGITAVGAAALCIFGGFMLFTFDSLAEMAARGSGHVVLSHSRYFEEDEPSPLAYGLDSWSDMRKHLQQDPRVMAVLPRINFSGLISNGEKSLIYLGAGVDAAQEFKVHGPFLDIEEGGLLADVPGEVPPVMIGAQMAKDLNVHPGGVLTLLATTSKGMLNGIDVQVAGIYATGNPEMDKRALMVSLPAAQELLMSGAVSTLSIYLHDGGLSVPAGAEYAALYPTLKATQWSDLAFFYHAVRNLYYRIFGVFGIIILTVVLLSVANTMSMTVAERTREIGTMRALGSFPAQVLANFVLEAGIVGLAGSAIGMLIAGAITLALPLAGIMMPPPPGMNIGYPLIINFSWRMYALTGIMLTLITMFGSFIAARRGVQKPIVEALAHV